MISKYLMFLGIGHVLGDFYFQNEKIAKWKDEKYKGVLLHAIEYYIVFLLITLPVFSIDMIIASSCASVIHFLIDTIKYLIVKRKIKKTSKVFLLDQCAHIICLLGLAYIMSEWNFLFGEIKLLANILQTFGCNTDTLVRWTLAILLIHIPSNILIQNLLGEYKPKKEEKIIMADHKAGRRIGTIERIIMLIFLSYNQYTAMGLVLTAKSIARYDKISKDEKFAEYYLLGTLLSILCVIMCKVIHLV